MFSTAQMKRPYFLDGEPFLQPDRLQFHQEPKEKRLRSVQESIDALSSAGESSTAADDPEMLFFPSDIDLTQYNQDWIPDIPQTLYLPLLDGDSSMSQYDQTLSVETFTRTCTALYQAPPTTSQATHVGMAPVQTPADHAANGALFQFFEQNDGLSFPDSDFKCKGAISNSSPSNETDQKFDPLRTAPRRPNSLKLTPNSADASYSGTSIQNFHCTNFSEDSFPTNVFPDDRCDENAAANLGRPHAKLPVMQSFLDLKKSPGHGIQSLPMVHMSLNSPVSYQALCTPRADAAFLEALASHNLGELCHHSLLQAYSESPPAARLAEAKTTVSPDTTYSPSNPGVYLPGHHHHHHSHQAPNSSLCRDEKPLGILEGASFYPTSSCGILFHDLSDSGEHLPNFEGSTSSSAANATTSTTTFAQMQGARAKGENFPLCTDGLKLSPTPLDSKTTILHALMEKIRRNQSAKNLSSVDGKKPDPFSATEEVLSAWNPPIKTEAKVQQESESCPGSGRNRTNSYSKVTVGEADTSSQDSSNVDRKVHQRMEGGEMYLVDQVIPDFLTSSAASNGHVDSFVFHLNAPISCMRKICKDPKITYLNKGQYYVLSMDCVSEKLKSSQAVLKTVVAVLFQDAAMVGNELGAWKVWHNKQQSFKQRILDVDFKNSNSGSPRGLEEMAYNATAVVWEAGNPGIKVNVAVNCLSTDFSNQKGVKGIPLLIQLDTYLDDEMIHRSHCNIKVFCDKGAERKVRDEERKRREHKMSLDDNLNLPTSSTSPQPPASNFHSSNDFSKVPLLFNPKPNVPIKTNPTRTFEPLKSEPLDRDKSQGTPDKIILYVKEEQEKAFNALVLDTPTVQGLLQAIATKYNLRTERIKNLYKKSKRGILVKIDDQVIRHYGNESTYIIHHSLHHHSNRSSPLDGNSFDVTLQEI